MDGRRYPLLLVSLPLPPRPVPYPPPVRHESQHLLEVELVPAAPPGAGRLLQEPRDRVHVLVVGLLVLGGRVVSQVQGLGLPLLVLHLLKQRVEARLRLVRHLAGQRVRPVDREERAVAQRRVSRARGAAPARVEPAVGQGVRQPPRRRQAEPARD